MITQEVKVLYADDLGVAAQNSDFSVVEEQLSNALSELTPYYKGKPPSCQAIKDILRLKSAQS